MDTQKQLSVALTTDAEIIDKTLATLFPVGNAEYEVLKESMRYSLFTGGKRVRPFLTLEFCRLFGGDIGVASHFAAALECVHTYSLIHDDLPCMDNDDFRRGKPTNHKEYGEATALLAGDSLLTEAFGIIARCEGNSETKIKAVDCLSTFAGADGMAGGQMLDLIGEKIKHKKDTFLLMNRLKTGCLIRCACIFGVLASGESKEKLKIAEEYGSRVGLAFQIEDDLIDEGEEDKTTFLSFMTKEEAKKEIDRLTDEAKALISGIDGGDILCGFADWLATRKV